ncbi:MAG: adenylate cyclase regulatory domain-containing protein [Solirubrobacteraceae bacterium]|nr:adenylate cyclase regulatory domain-containing protein [Solirubrobacteraceae bacterium]
MADPDTFDDAGLLDGLSGAAYDERLELLLALREEFGMSNEALRQSTQAGTIVLAAAGRKVGFGDRYTAEDIARLSGLDLHVWTSLVRASALPSPIDLTEVAYSETHLETARTIQRFVTAGVQPEQLINVARVLGRGLAQAADMMRQTVMELAIAPGVSEAQLARTYAATTEGLTPLLGPLLEQMLRLHLHNVMRDEIVTDVERRDGAMPGARPVGVAFADLVGFTRLGEQLAPADLEQVADRLVVLTGQVIDPRVRLVKSVGDAVLLVSPDPAGLVDTALALLELVEEQGDDFPQVRIGLAYGEAMGRGGDWFGRPVNLASRITGVARAGSIVADAALHAELTDDSAVHWSSVGERRLKGIKAPVRLYRARRPKLDGTGRN